METSYRQLREQTMAEVRAGAWRTDAENLKALLDEACAVRTASPDAVRLARRLRGWARRIARSPFPEEVLGNARQDVVRARGARTEDDVWLGDAWLDATHQPVAPPPAEATEQLRLLNLTAHRHLVVGLAQQLTALDAPSVYPWADQLDGAVERVPGEVEAARRAVRSALAAPPRLVLLGDYSAGTSSLVKRMLVEDGIPPPSDLHVRADPTTAAAAVQRYRWDAYALVDTPRFQSGDPRHEAAAVAATR